MQPLSAGRTVRVINGRINPPRVPPIEWCRQEQGFTLRFHHDETAA
jgi:hypothetical protein